MASRTFHILKIPEGWAVQRVGDSHPAKVCPEREEAIQAARQFAAPGDAELVIHDESGQPERREHLRSGT